MTYCVRMEPNIMLVPQKLASFGDGKSSKESHLEVGDRREVCYTPSAGLVPAIH